MSPGESHPSVESEAAAAIGAAPGRSESDRVELLTLLDRLGLFAWHLSSEGKTLGATGSALKLCPALRGAASADGDGFALDGLDHNDRRQLAGQLRSWDRHRPIGREVTLLLRTGEPLPVKLQILPLEKEESLAVAAEIQAQKTLEAKVLMLETIHSASLMTRALARDLHNILSGIHTGLCAVVKELDQGHPHFRPLLGVQRLSRQGNQLLDKIDLVSDEGHRLEIEPVDANRLMTECIELLQPTFARRVQIEWLPAADLPPVAADRTYLFQVIFNLIINCREALGDHGRIAASTRREDSPATGERLSGAQSLSEPHCCIRIEDNGPGIDIRTLARILDGSASGRDQRKQHGLGLSISKDLVEKMGGCFEIDSVPARGTTFSVLMPFHIGLPEAAEGPTGQETVLFIHRDHRARDRFAKILSSCGWEVAAVSDPCEAVERFEKAEVRRPDLVIVSQEILQENTYDLLRRVSGGGKQFRVLIASPEFLASLFSPRNVPGEESGSDSLLATIQGLLRRRGTVMVYR